MSFDPILQGFFPTSLRLVDLLLRLQNADRIRQERIARRAARAGLTPDQYEVGETTMVVHKNIKQNR